MAAADKEQEELAGLDRVLTRLALTEDDKLEGVLQKLLPLVIGKLNGAAPPVQKKVLEILAHTNKRLKAHPELQLPLHDLVALAASPSAGPMARNFALVYVENAAGRAPPEARFAELDALLTGIAGRPAAHQEIILRIAAQALEQMAQQVNAFEYGKEEQFAARYRFLTSEGDRSALLAFGAKLMLYQPPVTKAPTSALQAAQQQAQAQQQAAMEVDGAAVPPPPPGMSRAGVAAVEGKQPPTADLLSRRKLGLLNFSATAGLDPTETLLIYLAAAADPNEQVLRRGEELLKKRAGVDSQKPSVNLEDPALVEQLYELFHGTLEDNTLPEQDRRAPANVSLRSRLLGLFTKSVAAANCFPHSLTTVTGCLYGASTTPRLRQQGMELAVWVFRNAEPAQLAPAAAAILEGCLSLLDHESTQGLDSVALMLRGFTYQAIGQLAQRQPKAFAGRIDIAARFFKGLATEPAGVRAAVQESVGSLGGAFKGCTGEVQAEVQNLLLENVQASQEVVRMAALQWALKLFPFSDITARYVCILAAADTRFSIAEAALDGLKPDKFAAMAATSGSGPSSASGTSSTAAAAAAVAAVEFPGFESLLAFLLTEHRQLGRPVEEGAQLPLPAKAFAAAVAFLERCREKEGLPEATTGAYLQLLENGLVRDAPSELHATVLAAMLAVAARHRTAFIQAFAGRTSLLLRLLGHTDAGAREKAAKLLGLLVPALSPHQVKSLTDGLLESAVPAEGKKVRFEETDGAITALGFVAAQLILEPAPSSEAAALASSVLTQLQQPLKTPGQLAASAALALGHASLALWGREAQGQGAAGEQLGELPPPAAVEAVAALLQDKDVKVVRRAAQALGYVCRGHAGSARVLGPAVEALLGLRTQKSEEVLFAVGEALCFAFGGVQVSATDVLCANYSSLADWMQRQQQAGSKPAPAAENGDHTPQPMEADAPQAAAGGEEAASAGAGAAAAGAQPAPLAEAQSKILNSILDDYIVSTRPEVRCAGAVWLVSLVLYTRGQAPLMRQLPTIQDSLSHLLGDANELTQEMASRGLAAVYDLADAAARQALVDALVATLSGAPQKRRAVKLADDTEVFEGGQLGKTPGGAGLTTYKELCSLATELGQPDLVYRFMELANAQAALNSSRGAAFGFASIAKLAGEAQLGPHVARIIPRLYRYLYDPNGKVRDAMSHIWHALLDDPKRSVDQHFAAIAGSLLKEMGANSWRVRESAAAAWGDLLQGRRWEELQPFFEQLWVMTFRVMDDIKESVRAAGLALARSVRGVTLRLADPELTPAAQGRQAISIALPLLLEKGLPSTVPEIQALSLDTAAKLVKAAGAELVRPHMPLLVPAVLEALSGLENAQLNYLEQHAAGLGLDAGRLERARVSAAQSSPAGDTLDLCARYIDAATLGELAPKLAALVRRGVGLNTRAGAGRFISQVARRLGSDVQPVAAQLIKALVEACRADRSGSVKRSFAAANAAVAKFAASARVAKLVADCLEMYSGEDADQNNRLVAGLLLRELGKEAGDVFVQHASSVAPLAYMAQCDDDTSVAAMWGEVWEESTTSAGGGLRLHIKEIAQLITAGLQSGQWGRKKASAAALKRACAAAPDALQPLAPQLMEQLLKELPGRLWDGKEAVLEAVGALAAACPELLLAAPAGSGGGEGPLAGRVVAALVDAASKKKSAYKKAALEQLDAVLVAFKPGGSQLEACASLLLGQCTQFVAAAAHGPQKMDVDGAAASPGRGGRAGEDGDKPAEAPVPIAQVVSCLAAAWCTAGAEAAQRHLREVLSALNGVLGAAGKAADQLAAAAAATRFAEHCGSLAAGGAPGLLATDAEGGGQLLAQALRLAGEGKAAALREQALALAKELLTGSGLWEGMGGEVREGARRELRALAERERLPALQAQADAIAAQLPP